MKKKTLHIIKNDNGGWCVKVSLLDLKFPIFKTQQSAINHAIDKARIQKNTQIIIYAKSGKIREKMKF